MATDPRPSTTPLMASTDRRVHARIGSRLEVVRYERAGKWWIEANGGEDRVHVSITKAADVVRDAQIATVFFGLPGGSMFDRKVRGLA